MFLHLGHALFGKSNLPLILLWLHQTEKPEISKMFPANYIAGKREEMLSGFDFGFKAVSGPHCHLRLKFVWGAILIFLRWVFSTDISTALSNMHVATVKAFSYVLPSLEGNLTTEICLFCGHEIKPLSTLGEGTWSSTHAAWFTRVRSGMAHWCYTGKLGTVWSHPFHTRNAKHPSALVALGLAMQQQHENWTCP